MSAKRRWSVHIEPERAKEMVRAAKAERMKVGDYLWNTHRIYHAEKRRLDVPPNRMLGLADHIAAEPQVPPETEE
mgnify:CR=1 FL=1